MTGDIGLAIIIFFYLSIIINVWMLWTMMRGHAEVHQKVNGQINYVQNQLLARINVLECKLQELQESKEEKTDDQTHSQLELL